MAEGRQESEWLRTGVSTAWIINRLKWGGDQVSPLAIIPQPFRPPAPPPRKLTAEELESESRRAWMLLDSCFRRGA